jgi:hypothetical protein
MPFSAFFIFVFVFYIIKKHRKNYQEGQYYPEKGNNPHARFYHEKHKARYQEKEYSKKFPDRAFCTAKFKREFVRKKIAGKI